MLKRTIFILLICTLSISIYSQRTISLDEARELAIRNNKELKIASEEERIAYYEKREAFLNYFPKISATGMYIRNQKDLYLLNSSLLPPSIHVPLPSGSGLDIPIPGEINQRIHDLSKLEIKNIWVGNISLTQPLFMGGRIVAYNDIMKHAQNLAKTQKDSKIQDLIVETDAVYWQVVSLVEKKKLAESYLGLLTKLTSDITIMQEEGVSTKADVLSVMVQKNEAEVALTKVDNGLSLSRMLLNQLCGIPIEEFTRLTDEGLSLTEETLQEEIPNIEEALLNRSEIKSLKLITQIYKGKEKVAHANFLPEVGLTAGYLITNPNGFNGFQNKFGGMWNIGIAINIPLNILTNNAKLNTTKAQTQIQEYKLEEAKEKIELQVNQSAFKLNEAHKKYVATKKNMEKANENLRYANIGFEEGVIPPSNVLAAHTAWLSANSELIDAQIDIHLSKVYLNKSLGRTLYSK